MTKVRACVSPCGCLSYLAHHLLPDGGTQEERSSKKVPIDQVKDMPCQGGGHLSHGQHERGNLAAGVRKFHEERPHVHNSQGPGSGEMRHLSQDLWEEYGIDEATPE